MICIKIYTQFGEKPSVKGITFTKASLTDQTFKDECDIHHIIRNFGQTGLVVSPGSHETLQYGDATLAPDFQTAQNMVIQVTNEFNALPSNVRREYMNNPMMLLNALGSTDANEIAKLERLGLKQKSTVSSDTTAAVNAQTADGNDAT